VDQFFYYFYHVMMVLSLVGSFAVVLLTWSKRASSGARSMMFLAMATFVWALGFLLETGGETLERQVLFDAVGYIGSMTVPPFLFLFALQYTDTGRIVERWKKLLFFIIPVVMIVLVWTNGSHHFMWSNEYLTTSGLFTITAKTYGIGFWIAYAYNYILVIAAAFLLIRRLFIGTRLYAGQAFSQIGRASCRERVFRAV
jgi:hypothetical protein